MCSPAHHFTLPIPSNAYALLQALPKQAPFLGCSLWILIFPINLSGELKYPLVCSSGALRGSFLTFSFSSPWRGWEEKKINKTPPVFKERGVIPTWCGGSESSWLFLGRVFFMFSPFPRLCHKHFTRRGSVGSVWQWMSPPVPSQHSPGAPVPLALLLLLRARGPNSSSATAAQQLPGPLANIPPLLSRVVCFQRNLGKTSETIRENGERAQSNLAKINTHQKPKIKPST